MQPFSNNSRVWVIFIVCIVLSLFFIAVNISRTSTNNRIESTIISALAPIQNILNKGFLWFADFYHTYVFLVHVKAENKVLRQEVEALRWEINQYKEIASENERLRRLLDYSSKYSFSFIVAEVICWDSSNWSSSLFVNRGSNHHITKDMAVLTHEGIVGQVIRTTPWVSEIQIILSPQSGVSAFVQRTRSQGIVTGGLGRNRCLMKYIDNTETPLAEDMVVTSGHDRIFPKGLPLGRIVKTERLAHQLLQSVVISTAVDFSRLEEVLILTNQKPVTEESTGSQPQ